jgi:hypothetical protein
MLEFKLTYYPMSTLIDIPLCICYFPNVESVCSSKSAKQNLLTAAKVKINGNNLPSRNGVPGRFLVAFLFAR